MGSAVAIGATGNTSGRVLYFKLRSGILFLGECFRWIPLGKIRNDMSDNGGSDAYSSVMGSVSSFGSSLE